MNALVLLEALRARLGLFLIAVGLTCAAATTLSLWMPETFRATATVLVAEPPPGSGFVAPQERQAYMQTQEDIVASDRVARQVLSAQGGASVRALLEGLSVDTAQSNIIRVRYDAPDAVLAATLANAFARAYVEATAALRSEDTQRTQLVLDGRLAALRQALLQAQQALTAFQLEHGMSSTDASTDPGQMRLGEISAQLARAREQALEQAQRRSRARALQRTGSELEELPEVLGDTQVQRLSLELAQGEAKLQQIAQQYGTDYPFYRRQAAENESRRAALGAQSRRVVAALDSAAEQAQHRVAELESTLAAQREALLGQLGRRHELGRLVQNLESARRTYEAAEARFVVDLAERRAALPQLSVLGEAEPPRRPHRPRLALNLLAALVLGSVLGLAAITALEMGDRRVRIAADLRLAGPAPLLGVVSPWSPAPRALPAGMLPGIGHDPVGVPR